MSPASPRRSWTAHLPASTPFIASMSIGAGLLLLALAAVFALHTRWSVRSFMRTTATVTENVPTQDAEGNVLYTTHLRFQMSDGKIVTFFDPIRSSENSGPGFAEGEIIPALYPIGHPEQARIGTIWRLYFIANVLGILGVIFVDLGLILRSVYRRSRQQIP